MEWFNVEFLSRLQFAVTIMFHYIFPPFSIGLGLLLVIYESIYVFTKNKQYESIAKFWTKIFAANFSVGVATGIVMEFEFGTNWATYSRFVGDIFGSPLAAEGIFAFFLESGFLALLLFGWDRVKPPVHLFATCMVFLGSVMSGFWIVVANSWMQTPVAYQIVTDSSGVQRAVISDFWGMVFNPSAMIRFQHTIVGAFIQGSFLVLSVSAYYLLKNKHLDFARKSFLAALAVATLASLIQPILGHEHATVVAKYQPAKLAAFEGLYKTEKGAPLYLFGYADSKTQQVYGLAIPGGLSYMLYGDFKAEVKGLDQIPKDEWPAVNAVFQSYHLMVALGIFFIALTLFSWILIWRKVFYNQKWLLRIFMFAVVLPVIANQAGWVSAERGRQPWIVQGLLKTSEGVSKSITAPEVFISLLLFIIVYILLALVWLYVLDREIKHGPGGHIEEETLIYGKNKSIMDKMIDLNVKKVVMKERRKENN